MSAADLLGPDGPLSRALPGYEARVGQLAMAAAVERTLSEDRVLLTEAGTGTGKTLAYLVPAILSGRKVVISTATRALQDQIFWKDLPLIERSLGLRPHAALMKGLGNYVCRRRFEEHRRGSGASRGLAVIEPWVLGTESGDVSELVGLSEDDPSLQAVTSSSDTRVGASCQYHDECFVTRMKREADAARLVVVNHHLFFADLALRGEHPGRVLPDYDAVIFDEAHQLEDVATTFFGVRVSQARITRLMTEVERALALLHRGAPGRESAIVATARHCTEEFFGRLGAEARGAEGRAPLERDFWVGEKQAAWHRLDDALDAVRSLAESLAGSLTQKQEGSAAGASRREAYAAADGLAVAGRRAQSLRTELATIVDSEAGRVTWIDTNSRSPALSSSPVDVSALFRTRIFESIPAVVLTSATLTSGTGEGKAFTFLRSRLGLDPEGLAVTVDEQVVPSPFDYETSSILYLPRDLPEPSSPAFVDAASARIAELVEVTGGGAFVLTTSLRSMRLLHESLRSRLPGLRVLVQGAGPKAALIETFRRDGHAVLVATASFWQGVDVPGDALRLVVLEKIPFPVPTEPVILARSRALEEQGGKPFVELHLPLAKIALKQGFGRLIRTREDRGIVALLDDRVHRRGYGKELLAALPPSRRTGEIEEVRALWPTLGGRDADGADDPGGGV